MVRLTIAVLAIAFAGPTRIPADGRDALSEPPIVAIIVGPVGPELTPTYVDLAELSAVAAEERGAEVRRAYSPDATAENVLAAVAGANVVVYFGHGIGAPNPYSEAPRPGVVNGWGLQGPNAHGTHADSWQDGTLAYYGEAWIAANARPAPGWVMIYSPGAGEGFEAPADEETALARVSAYSRTPLGEMGASAYFATDFYGGAAALVATPLDHPDATYADVFGAEPRFTPDAVSLHEHGSVADAEVWLHRSPYFEGRSDYWYAFAGDPDATFGAASGSHLGGPRWQPGLPLPASGSVVGQAAAYGESPGYEGQATAAVAPELADALPDGASSVTVCGDRCAELRVVGRLSARPSVSAVAGTPPPALALSQAAWLAVSDQPLGAGPLQVRISLRPLAAAELPSVPPAPPSTPSPTPIEAGEPDVPAPPAPPDPSVLPSASGAPVPSPSPSHPPTPTPSPTPAATPSAPSDTPTPSPDPSQGPTPSPLPTP